MQGLLSFLQNLILFSEGIAVIVAFTFLKRTKENYWKYFALYLLIIFLCEAFGKWGKLLLDYNKMYFFNYFVIPLQFVFLYWLYAMKSLKRPVLFYGFTFIYLLSLLPYQQLFTNTKTVFLTSNYTFGCLLLLILVVLEFYKQITSENIINFQRNNMFYINLGVVLFYIGTLPFFSFYEYIYENNSFWKIYFSYFLISGALMYLLFAISFIWGKQNYT